MKLDRSASTLGVAASLALLAALLAPYVLVESPGTGLAVYYRSGPVGAAALGFFALLAAVVILSGTRGSADPALAAGIGVVLGVAVLLVALSWATAVDVQNVYSFPASWMEHHRWVVVGLAALLFVGTAGYAKAVV